MFGKAYAEHFSGFETQNLFLHESSFKKGLGQWGRSIGPGPRAHMGLGISVPYRLFCNWGSKRLKVFYTLFELSHLIVAYFDSSIESVISIDR